MVDRSVRRERLELLLVQEIRRVTEDLERRKPLLVEVWGRQRIRAPFLDSTFSRWKTLGFETLMVLDRDQIEALEGFFRELDDTRLYLLYTEDMPRALDRVLTGALTRLKECANQALCFLGSPPIGDPQTLPWLMQTPAADDADPRWKPVRPLPWPVLEE